MRRRPQKPALLLRLRAELGDGAHRQRSLHADEGPKPGVARLQFQRGQAVIHRTATGAAVPGQVGAEQAEPPHLRNDLGGKHPFSYHSLMLGLMRSRTNARTVSRQARSSADNKASRPR